MTKQDTKNKYFFGLGTFGRDMLYSLVSMYFISFATEALDLSDSVMWVMSVAFLVLGIFDACNDPITGIIIDNTRTRWGKFKPWIVIGAILGGILTILLFADLGLTGPAYIIFFIVVYVLWDIIYGLNDIAYWTLMPSLSVDQKVREKIGAFARICASVGMYAVVLSVTALTDNYTSKRGFFLMAIGVTVITWVFLCFTVFGVKENKAIRQSEDKTSLRDVWEILKNNDQLRVTALSMGLFMIGYCTTTGFGTYYFKYVFKNPDMYTVFAGVLGVSQLASFLLFPKFSKRFDRKTLYTASTVMVFVGYIIFFFASSSMILVGVAGLLIFAAQAFIQLLMLMFLADTIEYGQWKMGKRNESVTFSVQPFVNKIGGAISKGIVSVTLIISGINSAVTVDDVTDGGILIVKLAMLILPLISIVAGFLVYRKYFKIDAKLYDTIISDLKAKGEITE
ncbi:MAG: MFS transporter [Oscillospiraceae bacterium]|nr:MFS transporter [Oscillospiraceae bacterium]